MMLTLVFSSAVTSKSYSAESWILKVHRQTRQPVAAGWNVPGTVQVGTSAATTKEGRSWQIVAGKLQAYLQPVDSVQGSGEAGASTSATSSDELYKLQPVSVCLQTRSLH